MTVLFGSYATASSRAPTHASENNEDSLNRLLDDQATEVKNLVGDKLVSMEHFVFQEKRKELYYSVEVASTQSTLIGDT